MAEFSPNLKSWLNGSSQKGQTSVKNGGVATLATAELGSVQYHKERRNDNHSDKENAHCKTWPIHFDDNTSNASFLNDSLVDYHTFYDSHCGNAADKAVITIILVCT